MELIRRSQDVLCEILRSGDFPLPEDLAVVSSCYLPALFLRCHHDAEFLHFAQSGQEMLISILSKYINFIGMLLAPERITTSKKIFRDPAVVRIEFHSLVGGGVEIDPTASLLNVEPLSDVEVFLQVRNLALKVWGIVNYIFISFPISKITEFAQFSENLSVRVSLQLPEMHHPVLAKDDDDVDVFVSKKKLRYYNCLQI